METIGEYISLQESRQRALIKKQNLKARNSFEKARKKRK